MVVVKKLNINSKMGNGGWFTTTRMQIYERMRALERPYGMIENNFYCSQECKDTCLLYGLKLTKMKGNYYEFKNIIR